MVQLFVNYEKIIFKFVVLSIALARPDTILPVVREITRRKGNNSHKKGMQTYWEYAKCLLIFKFVYSVILWLCSQCYLVAMSLPHTYHHFLYLYL
jgi:hypothetical protein